MVFQAAMHPFFCPCLYLWILVVCCFYFQLSISLKLESSRPSNSQHHEQVKRTSAKSAKSASSAYSLPHLSQEHLIYFYIFYGYTQGLPHWSPHNGTIIGPLACQKWPLRLSLSSTESLHGARWGSVCCTWIPGRGRLRGPDVDNGVAEMVHQMEDGAWCVRGLFLLLLIFYVKVGERFNCQERLSEYSWFGLHIRH